MLYRVQRGIIKLWMIISLITEYALVSSLEDLPNVFLQDTDINRDKLKVDKKCASEINVNAKIEDDDLKELIKRFPPPRDEYLKVRASRQGPKVWDQWGKWSNCSVTCGIGKLTRWRHCIAGSCSVGEKKAQIKTCTLAAC